MEILNITIYISNNIYIYLITYIYIYITYVYLYIYIYKYGSWSSQSQFFTRNSWTLENSMYVHKYSAFIHICIYIYDLYLFGGVNWLLGTSQPWATYPMHFIFLYIRIRYHYISIKYNIIKHIIEYNVMYYILHIFTYIYIY